MSLTTQPTPEQIRLSDREETQYLLGNPPSWMMRYGITVMGGFVVLLLLLAYFIRYPDIVEAKISLTTAHPPIRVLARSSGRVTTLLVGDKKAVQTGQVLAIIENTADWQDVLHLETWLGSKALAADSLLSALQLGSLQPAYSSFSQHWNDYRYFASSAGTAARIVALRQQMGQLAAAEATALQNQLQIQQLESQINELQQTKSDHRNDKELVLAEDLQRLRSELAAWKQSYVVVAPISGQISLSNIWSNQQAIASGEEVLAIIPANANNRDSANQSIVGRATLSGQGFGKIQLGICA